MGSCTDPIGHTLAQRCKLATDCLPDAEYRRMLEALHGELLAAVAEPVTDCGETCKRARLCCACSRELSAQAEPLAWRDHVEQRIRTWRRRTMNEAGDCLAIGEFLCRDSIDDLVDFVCDEKAAPATPQPARQPLTDAQISEIHRAGFSKSPQEIDVHSFARAVELAHGIGGKP